MTSLSKNVYVDKLDDIVNEYNNTYNTKIEMKPANANSSIRIDFDVKNNDKDLKFKVGDHVRISRYRSVFAKGYTINQTKEVFKIKKVKNTVPWSYVIEDLNEE